jgi:hypothetical protein
VTRTRIRENGIERAGFMLTEAVTLARRSESMRKKALCSLVVLACAVPLGADGLSQQDRDKLVNHLKRTRDGFVASVKGLTEAQLKYRPSPESWTVAECAEHIAVSEGLMFKGFEDDFLKLAPTPGKKSETPDEKVLEYADRSKQRGKAEPAYEPKGRWPTIEATLEHFEKSRERTLRTAMTTKEDLRSRYHEKAKLDSYQFLLILSAHTERHTRQIDEIKKSAGFPK